MTGAISRLKKKSRKPGKISIFLEKYIQNGTPCFYCEKPTVLFQKASGRRPKNALTLDHILQKSKGGTFIISNLIPCCYMCNNKRANMDFIEFGIKSILKRKGIIK